MHTDVFGAPCKVAMGEVYARCIVGLTAWNIGTENLTPS
jgi:hypothetical protein